MASLIEDRVELARRGQNQFAFCRMTSGRLVAGDTKPLPGYSGATVLAVAGAYRSNYEMLGDGEAALHTHVIPRYLTEPDEECQHLNSGSAA